MEANPSGLTLDSLLKDLPFGWDEQRKLILRYSLGTEF
jgi:hypothetical protein